MFQLSPRLPHLQNVLCVPRYAADRRVLFECAADVGLATKSNFGRHKAMDRGVSFPERSIRCPPTGFRRRCAEHLTYSTFEEEKQPGTSRINQESRLCFSEHFLHMRGRSLLFIVYELERNQKHLHIMLRRFSFRSC